MSRIQFSANTSTPARQRISYAEMVAKPLQTTQSTARTNDAAS